MQPTTTTPQLNTSSSTATTLAGTNTGSNAGSGSQAQANAQALKPIEALSPVKISDYNGDWEATANNRSADLQKFDQNAKTAIDVYNETMAKYGINDMRTRLTELRSTLTNTENAIRNVESDVQGRTQESNLSENQRKRIVQQDQEPLIEALRTQNQSYTNAQQDLTTAQDQAKGETDITVQSLKAQRDAMLEQYQIAADNAKTQKEEKRWWEEYNQKKAAFNEQIRQFEKNLQVTVSENAKDRASRAKAASAANAKPSVNTALQQLFYNYKPVYQGGTKDYTENVVIRTLMNDYGMNQSDAAKMAYSYRKTNFGEGYGYIK